MSKRFKRRLIDIAKKIYNNMCKTILFLCSDDPKIFLSPKNAVWVLENAGFYFYSEILLAVTKETSEKIMTEFVRL